MRALAMLTILAVAAAARLPAQRPGGMGGMMHGRQMGPTMQGMGMDSMMAPMMRVMMFAPGRLLDQQAVLHLTADQVSRLTTLRDVAQAGHDASATQATAHLREMEQAATAAAPDTVAVRTHFDVAHRLMRDAMWTMVRATVQARGLLSDAQRHQADSLAAHGRAGGMMMQH